DADEEQIRHLGSIQERRFRGRLGGLCIALDADRPRLQRGIVSPKGRRQVVQEEANRFARINFRVVLPMEDRVGQYLLAAHEVIAPQLPLFAPARLLGSETDDVSHNVPVFGWGGRRRRWMYEACGAGAIIESGIGTASHSRSRYGRAPHRHRPERSARTHRPAAGHAGTAQAPRGPGRAASACAGSPCLDVAAGLAAADEGRQAALVREWGTALARFTHLRVEYWDERLTTVEAERVLRSASSTRLQRRRAVDKMAAAILLQSFLEARPPRL